MPDSTIAGIITATATVITASGGLVLAVGVLIPIWRGTRRTETKVDEVHTIVNQQRTDMQTVIVNQQRQLIALEEAMAKAGLTIPVGPSTTGEPIVTTAVIAHGAEAASSGPDAVS